SPEGMVQETRSPLVGLRILNKCPGFVRDGPSDGKWHYPVHVGRWSGLTDRKLRVLTGWAIGSPYEFTDEMVERRTKIVEQLPDERVTADGQLPRNPNLPGHGL